MVTEVYESVRNTTVLGLKAVRVVWQRLRMCLIVPTRASSSMLLFVCLSDLSMGRNPRYSVFPLKIVMAPAAPRFSQFP